MKKTLTQTPANMEDYMTIKEATSEFPIKRTSIYEKIKDGVLKKHKFFGKTFVKKSDIVNVIRVS